MNQIALTGQQATMSSREIAELTGKNISHVHRDIMKMMVDIPQDDPERDHVRYEKDERGYMSCVHLPKELSLTLVAGYSVQVRRAIIKRWQELENAQKPVQPAELSRMDILQIAMEAEKGRLLALEERDEARRTKAEIGSRREATAMATASAKAKEVQKLKAIIGESAQQATVTAVENVTKHSYGKQGFRPLKKWCKERGIQANDVHDARYGSVKAWPAQAWREVYGVDLSKIFK